MLTIFTYSFIHYFLNLLASSISLVSSFASVIAILITMPMKPTTTNPITPKIIFHHIVFKFKAYIYVFRLFNSIDYTSQAYHLNLAQINCGTFHSIFSNFVKVGFMPCD